MDLNEVAIFIQVVQSGSFSQAALKLGMPNSTVSSKISSLEKRLGVTLIQRTTRQLHVTPAGQTYFQKCVQGLDEIRGAESEMVAAQGEPQGLFRITAPVELGTSILPDLLADYVAKFPKVRVETILTERRVDLLGEGVDLAIRAGELKDSTLIARKIGVVCFALFATAKYLKSHGTLSHPRDLQNHQCIQFTPVGVDEWSLVSARGSFNALVPGRLVLNDLNAVKRLALMNVGVAYLPSHLCHAEIQSGRLVRVLPEWRSTLTPVHFVYPAQKFITPKLDAFMGLSMERLKESFKSFEC